MAGQCCRHWYQRVCGGILRLRCAPSQEDTDLTQEQQGNSADLQPTSVRNKSLNSGNRLLFFRTDRSLRSDSYKNVFYEVIMDTIVTAPTKSPAPEGVSTDEEFTSLSGPSQNEEYDFDGTMRQIEGETFINERAGIAFIQKGGMLGPAFVVDLKSDPLVARELADQGCAGSDAIYSAGFEGGLNCSRVDGRLALTDADGNIAVLTKASPAAAADLEGKLRYESLPEVRGNEYELKLSDGRSAVITHDKYHPGDESLYKCYIGRPGNMREVKVLNSERLFQKFNPEDENGPYFEVGLTMETEAGTFNFAPRDISGKSTFTTRAGRLLDVTECEDNEAATWGDFSENKVLPPVTLPVASVVPLLDRVEVDSATPEQVKSLLPQALTALLVSTPVDDIRNIENVRYGATGDACTTSTRDGSTFVKDRSGAIFYQEFEAPEGQWTRLSDGKVITALPRREE